MIRVFLGIVLLLGLSLESRAADDDEFDAVHHTANGYYLDFSPIGKLELPRLFIVQTETGLQWHSFSSTKSALRSEIFIPEASHTAEDDSTAESHTVDAEALIADGKHLDAHLIPASGSVIIDISITRHLIFAFLACGLMLLAFISLARRYARGIGRTSAPKGILQNVLETFIIFIRDDIALPNLGEKHYRRFLPFLLTLFFFILLCNLLGLVPWGATASSNINVTAALAIFTFVITQFNGSRSYWQHIFWPPGIPTPVRFLLIPTEILGIFVKPLVLAIRLFANTTAGHLVILSIIGMIFTFASLFGPAGGWGMAPVAVGFTLFINLLELLIALIQAYIFTFLSALFIGMAVVEHDHAHEGAH